MVTVTNEETKKYLEKFKPYINRMAKRYTKRYFGKDDVVSWANMGIVKALERVDHNKNPNSFIMSYINHYILLGVKSQANFIKLKSKTFNAPDELKKINKIFSLQSGVSGSNDDSKQLTLSDIIPSGLETPYEAAESNELRGIINSEIDKLNEEEKDIIHKRFFEDATLQSIADDHGVTREWIRKQLGSICVKLKGSLQDKV